MLQGHAAPETETGWLVRAVMDARDADAGAHVLRCLREALRADHCVSTLSTLERQMVCELARADPTRVVAMSVMLLGVAPAHTPPLQRLAAHCLVLDHEMPIVAAWLASLPALVSRHLRTEANLRRFVQEAREEMVLCAPYALVVPPPEPEPGPEPGSGPHTATRP